MRRRVGVIVLCDNACDPNYQFEDLGNLARKIRTDFGAEMLPIESKRPLAGHFGTVEEFADPERRNGKCALLYRITYPAGDREPAPTCGTLLIVLKPNRSRTSRPSTSASTMRSGRATGSSAR